jgi:hypothetical protein
MSHINILIMKTTVVKTETGSIYVVVQRDNRFFLHTDHTPNSYSQDVNGEEWEIEVPEVPVVGKRWMLTCVHFSDRGHPNRMPGGGKYTSRVVEVHNEM